MFGSLFWAAIISSVWFSPDVVASTASFLIVSAVSTVRLRVHRRTRKRTAETPETIKDEAVDANTSSENQTKEMMAAQNNEPNMSQYAKPTLEGYGNGVAPPEITENFEIKSSTIHMVENSVQFHGLLDEDPLSHISRFLRICGTFKIQNCSEDQIKLKLFPFSLRGQALEWIESFPSGSITTWDQMVEQFLLKYFPPDKTAKYRGGTVSP